MNKITEIDKALAATNNPALSDMEITMGDRVFKVVYMKYRAQVAFLAMLQPLMESVAGQLAGIDSGATIAGLMKYCGRNLPEMAALVIQQSEPSVSVEELVNLDGASPFKFAALVMLQVKRNQMVEEIVSFFDQTVSLLKMAGLDLNQKKKSTTKVIPLSS